MNRKYPILLPEYLTFSFSKSLETKMQFPDYFYFFFSFEYFFSLDKFQVVHDKQQHPSGPGGSFGYGGGGGGSRRMVRGGAYFPTSFV